MEHIVPEYAEFVDKMKNLRILYKLATEINHELKKFNYCCLSW